MKKFKIFLVLLLFAVLTTVIWQNKAFFMQSHSFQVDPWLADPYATPELPIILICAGLFLIGFLIAYIHGLYGYFKQGKTIKHLNATVAARTEEIQTLRRRMEDLERPSATDATIGDPPPEAPAVDV